MGEGRMISTIGLLLSACVCTQDLGLVSSEGLLRLIESAPFWHGQTALSRGAKPSTKSPILLVTTRDHAQIMLSRTALRCVSLTSLPFPDALPCVPSF